MVAEHSNGTLDLTALDTEEDITTITDAGVYQLNLRLGELADDETVDVKAYLKVQSAATEDQVWAASVRGDQGDRALLSLPLMSAHSIRFSLEQSGGSVRDYVWSVFNV